MTSNSSFELRTFLKNLPEKPGVYQMINAEDKVIYVGKARNLKKRVTSYFSRQLDSKTQAMVAKIARIELIVTASENEALLLEFNLIKSLRPRYNILLKDDKAYPYLYLTTQHAFPRLDYCRGAKKGGGEYFGPYPNLYSVRESLALIQKLFRLRQCTDVYFGNRTRPCLQYQIKRCTAPCVGLVSESDYRQQVNRAIYFLQGKNDQIIEELQQEMERAAGDRQYEEAAHYRDQIRLLRRLQQQQSMIGEEGNVDILGVYQQHGQAAICVLQVRGGRLLSSRAYFPSSSLEASSGDLLAAFMPHYYLGSVRPEDVPTRIICAEPLPDRQWIQQALSEQLGCRFAVSDRKLARYRTWQKMAFMNAAQALKQQLAEKALVDAKFTALQTIFDLPNPIRRVECFDISHTRGEATVASCVVFTAEGPSNKDYRQYNITDITPGDDYAAMRQALTRRYQRVTALGAGLPDLLIIDGGKGQLGIAAEVLAELKVSGVVLLGVAKGPTRKPGYETLWVHGQGVPIELPPEHQALHLIQQIRDEAHRFAITAHRAKRSKQRQRSVLDDIEGVGAVRRQRLLKHFGGLQELKRASQEEIARVPGIGEALAAVIFSALHDSH